ncbi:MAG TPA: hypothetical protein VKF62_10430, partial [Planctomycetota bacterium]|nr:hypothetical protein [Planctomycetota bacterium]
YGFGFLPRADLERLVGEIQAACPPGLAVEGDSPIYAFAAGRDPAVAFAEFRGVLGELRDAIPREGLLGALRARRGRDFWATIEACFPSYADALVERVRRGEVGALVFDPDGAAQIARALSERGVPIRLDPEPRAGPREARVYRVIRER